MKRLISGAFTAASLVLCVASISLWVRSYWYFDIAGVDGTTGFSLNSYRGRLAWGESHWSDPRPTVFAHFATPLPDRQVDRQWREGAKSTRTIAGLGFVHEKDVDGERWGVLTPDWIFALLFAAWPAAWLLRRRNRHRSHGRCPVCGYDLRAHKPGDKCPECGTAKQGADPA